MPGGAGPPPSTSRHSPIFGNKRSVQGFFFFFFFFYYDEKAAYESYMNPEPGIQSGPGDSEDAD